MKLIARSVIGLWFLFCGVALAQTALFSHASTASLANNLVVETSPQHVLGYFNCTGVAGGAAGWCIAYNGSAAPGTGTLTGALVLDACYFDTSGKGCSINYSPGGIAFSVGITILVTTASTPFTYTTGTDTAFISANYN